MLIDEITANGQFLFRWRSYLPVIVFPLLFVGLRYPLENHFLHFAWELICPSLSVFGLVIRVATVGFAPQGTSGRGTKSMRADTLNTVGMYSVTRNPLYLGNFLIFLGVLLYVGSWYVTLIGALAFWLYYERIILAEEAFLTAKHGEAFRRWAASTPVFVPRMSMWRVPAASFSIRSVIRREYHTLFAAIFLFAGVEMARDYSVYHQFALEPHWRAIFLFGLGFYLFARFLAKRTHLLSVEGR